MPHFDHDNSTQSTIFTTTTASIMLLDDKNINDPLILIPHIQPVATLN